MYLSLFPFNLILFNSIYLPRTAGRLVLRRPMYLNSLRIVVAHESFVRGVLCQPSLYSSPRCVPCMQPCMQHDCSHLICCLHEPLYIERNGTGCSCCELICSIPADKNFHTWQAVGYSRQEKSAECLINLIWRGGGWTMYTDREINLECKFPDPTFLGLRHGRFSQFYHMKHVQQLLGRTPARALTNAISNWRVEEFCKSWCRVDGRRRHCFKWACIELFEFWSTKSRGIGTVPDSQCKRATKNYTSFNSSLQATIQEMGFWHRYKITTMSQTLCLMNSGYKKISSD